MRGVEEHGQTVPAAGRAWVGGARVGGAGAERIMERWGEGVDIFAAVVSDDGH
jgi:hypothetical protein